MSRSGYTDDYDSDGPNTIGLYRASVRRAINGKRGQAMLRDLAAALDAMPEKWLAAESLVTAEGEFCTLGVLGAARGIDLEALDPEDAEQVAKAFGIADVMAREIVYENDEAFHEYEWVDLVGPPERYRYYGHPQIQRCIDRPGEQRWKHMREWVAKHLKEQP